MNVARLQSRLSVLTIGVDDIGAMRDFYEHKFGWAPHAANQDVAFFKLNGLLLGLYSKRGLAAEAARPFRATEGLSFTLGYNVETEGDVDAIVAALEADGVEVPKRPHRTSYGGYAAFVADPEGNLWEIVANPHIELDAAGNVIRHAEIAPL